MAQLRIVSECRPRENKLNAVPFCIVGSTRDRKGDLGAVEKQMRVDRSGAPPFIVLPIDLPGLPARDSARAFTVDLLTAQSRDSHPPLVFPLFQSRFQVQETLTDSPCRIRLFCSQQFAYPPLLRVRLRQPQALGNARLPLDPRRRTDVARHRESHTGTTVMFPVSMRSARLNGSDSSRSEFANMRRRKLRASR